MLQEADVELQVNGQDGRSIEEVFTATGTTDLVGLVKVYGRGRVCGVAVELDAGNGILTTLPVER